MATLLDLSLINFFGSVFLFLFVFAIIWGALSITHIFKNVPGENGIYGLIALAVAISVVISPTITEFFRTLIPWFVVFVVVLFLIFMIFRMFSDGDGGQIKDAVRTQGVAWTLIVISAIIVIVSFSSTFGQELLDEQDPVSNIEDNNELNTADPSEIQVDDQVSDDTTNRRPATGSTNPAVGSSSATDDFEDNVLATIINPKVMGMIVMMVIAFFTILLIARTPDPDNQ